MRVTAHHRFLLGRLLEHVRFVESEIAELEGCIAERTGPFEKGYSAHRPTSSKCASSKNTYPKK